MRLPAVVTAGGRLKGEVAERADTTIKALVTVGGRTLLERVVSALRQSESVGKIVVVGPKGEIENAARQAGADLILDEAPTGPENVQLGLAAVKGDLGEGRALLSASDLPFLDQEALAALLHRTREGNAATADIVYPIVTRSSFEGAYPGTPNTWAKLNGVEYTGGSVFLVRPAALERNRELIAKVFEARKSQISMASLLGFGLAARFVLGRLTVDAAEQRASVLTGCRCHALRDADPRLSADMDTLADYEYALSRLGGK